MEQLLIQGTVDINLFRLALDALICAVMSFVLIWHYKKFSQVIANRVYFSRIFPTIMLTTLLIIAVVKSSLALSLGLIGALSIVRFRAPIKEPEELAYIFLAIGVGLGLGSGNRIATVGVAGFILVVLAIYNSRKQGGEYSRSYLSIVAADYDSISALQKSITDVINQHTDLAQLKRIDLDNESAEMVFYIDQDSTELSLTLIADLQEKIPGLKVTLLDRAEF